MGGGAGSAQVAWQMPYRQAPVRKPLLRLVHDADAVTSTTRVPVVVPRARRMRLEQQARDILFEHARYRDMDPDEIGARIDIPLDRGHADVVDGKLFLSWMRPTPGGSLTRQLNGDPPLWDDWCEAGPILWIVDLAATPGTSGVWVGRRTSKYLAQRGIARIGERVAFRRHSGTRFGWATVRG